MTQKAKSEYHELKEAATQAVLASYNAGIKHGYPRPVVHTIWSISLRGRRVG